ncbi:hypothetical protein HY572_03630 [Candidatus Micrarchaeota archaeon]|nr:hypothetical protein [Candidatus Micrarchaeota archaeon]
MDRRKEDVQPRLTLVRPRGSLAQRFSEVAGPGWQSFGEVLTHETGTWIEFSRPKGGTTQAVIRFTDQKTPRTRRDQSHKVTITLQHGSEAELPLLKLSEDQFHHLSAVIRAARSVLAEEHGEQSA